MEYKVKLTLNIFSEDRHECVSGSREISLPFPPYEGLEITEEWSHTFTIKSVTWSIDEQCFHCYVEDQEDLDDAWINIEFLVDEARKFGWVGFDKVMKI